MKLKIILVVCVWLITIISAKSQIIPFYGTEEEGELWKNMMSLSEIEDSTDIANFKGSLSYDVRKKDDVLCKLKNTRFIIASHEKINLKALICVKDSLKYLVLHQPHYNFYFYKFSKNNDIQLNALELLDGMCSTKILASLIDRSPKIICVIGYFGGNMKPLNNISNDSLRYVHIDLRAKKWYSKEKKVFPSALINAPKMEELYVSQDFREDRIFKMPEVTSDTLPLRRLFIPVDISDPYNLEQITKLRNLEHLNVRYSKYYESYNIEDEEKIQAEIRKTLKALEYIDELYFDGIKVKSSERNK